MVFQQENHYNNTAPTIRDDLDNPLGIDLTSMLQARMIGVQGLKVRDLGFFCIDFVV